MRSYRGKTDNCGFDLFVVLPYVKALSSVMISCYTATFVFDVTLSSPGLEHFLSSCSLCWDFVLVCTSAE